MRNVTISLDEEVARWVRVAAAEHDLSVSRYVGQVLGNQMRSERTYEQAMASFLGRGAKPLKTGGGYPARDEVHDRSLLR